MALERTRHELGEFLRTRRERISPEEVGLPMGTRRRTPGLRREEVAALAGVGLTWYTWLEQGREIGVSSTFLDNLAKALKLDAAERRHLFMLTHQRPPIEPGKTWCQVPPLVRRLMDDLSTRPSYVLNLRWDVLAWNGAADRIFDFAAQPAAYRNLLWMLFAEPALRRVIADWSAQAPRILSSFRRDYARADGDPAIGSLVEELKKVAPEFRQWWHQHDVHAPCQGVRTLDIDGLGAVGFEHTSLIVDESRHLRLVVYAVQETDPQASAFARWVNGEAASRQTPS
ncbi:helix-turn-helix transcriptional regulator [Halomonas sp. McH1-25]|uniref:helix-turn-helix transcriptional regulator n=1 Tax=unclassified Halomonas TaxID=2609666 RepID=UPI001EF5BEF7|nr:MULTISPECIES: helix-turn-helix transcriptional regulator [unclassified Halomonas]MCG7600783.1 helix-turn-helix transcriptional regulator [Halomonas sp. McH1-25]MCP1342748.1 helix-turn-helix transcriptional regulator [Halomonas sp. FL8]MCP1361053.1 helix-turn-helix transcriptional regulator [Halomonas sp. BBD45]MCP1366562.1 helix-turn-helix transcriptional regulator [Halomonas sp. BBD48]